jgi:hypothetical protein
MKQHQAMAVVHMPAAHHLCNEKTADYAWPKAVLQTIQGKFAQPTSVFIGVW